MEGKKLAIGILVGTIAVCVLIFLGFQLYYTLNPTQ